MAKLKLIAAVAIFGTIGVFVRYIPLPSSVLAMARGAVGAAFLAAVMGLSRQRPDRAAVRRNLPLLLLSGSAIGFNWILLFEAYRHTTVAVATLCYYLAPVFVILASPLALRERLTGRKLACVAVALAGMALVSGLPQGGTADVSAMGILCGTGAAVLYAGVILTNKFLRGLPAMETTIAQLAVAALVLVPYVLLTEDLSALTLTAGGAALTLTVGVVHTGVAYWLYFSAMPKLEGQTIALFSYIDPALAILLSALLLREPLDLWGGAGAALILGSTLAGELLDGREAKNRLDSVSRL